MKKITLILLLLLAAIVQPQKTFASHAAAGEIVYEWITGATYRFYFSLYRDCTGINEPDSVQLCFKNPCNTNLDFNVYAYKATGQNGITMPLCPGYKSTCDTSTALLPGYRKWMYTAVVTMSAQCNAWNISTYVDSRNTNINLTGLTSFYAETMMNNTGQYQNNSSPYFTTWPLPYVTIYQPTIFNNGAVDPDGDSLTTELIMPRGLSSSGCTNAPSNYSFMTTSGPNLALPYNPFQTNSTFATSLLTGTMSFTPQQIGSGAITARVKQYRNGVLIGYVDREVQIQVGSFGSLVVPVFGVSAPGVIQACIGQPLNFCWWTKSANPGARLLSSDDHALALPGSTVSYQLQATDSVSGCLSWTPGAGSVGLHTLNIAVKDSTCAFPGFMATYNYTVQVYVAAPAYASNDTTICFANTVQLTASGAGSYIWSVISGTPNSLSCTSCQSPMATPAATTTYQMVAGGTGICPNSKDTVTVTIVPYTKPAVTISVTPDTNVLAGTMLTFTATPVNCSTPTYQWQRNGKDLPGAKMATFSSANLVDLDKITVKMQCTDTCIIDAFSNALTLHISTGTGTIGIDNMAIHPNPNTGEFTITGYAGAKEVSVEIVNMIGQLIYRQSNIATANGQIDHRLNIGNISNGSYMLRIITGDKVFTERLTIQR